MLRERFDTELARRLCGKARTGARGMTLIEIMVVIAIIGIVAGTIAYGVITYFKKAKVRAAEMQIKQKVSTALQSYYLDEGEYPNTLDALLEGGYGMKEGDLRDPWKKDLIYNPNPGNGEDFQLCSGGPDGASGGGDDVCLNSRD